MTGTTAKRFKRRTQAARREESDRRMLRAATHLISRQGLGATTLAEIGLAAGYSSGLPVVRYGSKLGLIEALLDSMDRWCRVTFAAATAGRRGLDSLKARVEAHIVGARTIPDGATALQTILVEARFAFPDLQPRLAALTEYMRQGIRDDLLDAQRLGEVRNDMDCDVYAGLILGTIRGMMIDKIGHGLDELQRALPPLLCEIVQQSRPGETLVPS
jgi:AcrR family transcriptional regulator